MKKSYLLLSGLILSGFAANSQQNQQNSIPKINPQMDIAVKKVAPYKGDESGPYIGLMPADNAPRAINSEVVGQTIYDLQTNNSTDNRIYYWPSSGNVSAAWTMSLDSDPWPARGTGYNFRNSGVWGAYPSARIESVRTGWPSIAGLQDGSEIVIAHSGSVANPLVMNKRTTAGTGTWTQSTISTTTGNALIWPRVATSGNNIHVVALVDPGTQTSPITYMGQQGAMVYYRSTDGGATWDINSYIIPDIDQNYFTGFSGDAYAISANGNNVAIAIFNQLADIVLLKSNDNGTTWTKTTIADFPIDLYQIDQGLDINGDTVYDTVWTCDGAGAVVVAPNGTAHVFFGLMRVMDDNLTDASYSYFPGTNGLCYWREGMPALNQNTFTNSVITGAQDIDGNMQLDVTGLALYYVGLCSMPSAGVSPNGTIFVSYASIREDFESNGQSCRHIYAMKSTNGGNTWTGEVDLTPDTDQNLYEHVFASAAYHVDNKFRILFQRDLEPGLTIRGDLDPPVNNDIVYLEVDTVLGPSVGITEQILFSRNMQVYPNPSNGIVNITFETTQSAPIHVAVTNIIGQQVLSLNKNASAAGLQTEQLDLTTLTEGIYFITLTSGKQQITQKLIINK
jgi:hypothetical protein